MDANKHTKGVVTESLRLLKTLAGNDDVKREIGESNGIYIIIDAINKNIVRIYLHQMNMFSRRKFTLVSDIRIVPTQHLPDFLG